MEEEEVDILYSCDGDDEFELKEEDDLVDLLSSSSLENKIIFDELHNIDVRCEPVIDFLCAKVFIDSAHPSSVDVCGEIKILNNSIPNEIILYKRQNQRIYPPPHNFLQLILSPHEIPNLVTPSVFVDIKNVDTGRVIASGCKKLLKTIHKPYHTSKFESIATMEFLGDDGRVELQYAAFTFGFYAEVTMSLFKDDDDPSESHKDVDDDDEQGGVELFGMICAKCNPLLLPKESYENHMFNVIEKEPVRVGLGTEIPLFKNLVALPAYSDLEISVDLTGYEDDGFFVQGTACFAPGNFYAGCQDIRGANGFYVQVQVIFCEPSLLNKLWCADDRINCFRSVPRFPQLYASQILEVFSLFIGRPNCKEMNLYGTVKIRNSEGCCTIFGCSKNEPYFLSRNCNFLPLQGPKRVFTPDEMFFIEIDLSDVDGYVKIKGFCESNYAIEKLQRPWFDRQLCTVVGSANEKSFAAIYYTLFSYALQASLTVRCISKCRSSARVKIYGNVTVSYSKFFSSTDYYRQFFRVILFSRNEVNPLEGEENFKLSRSFLAVPVDLILDIKVNLFFQTSEGAHRVQKNIKLQIGEPHIAIESDYVDIFIDVTWKGFPYVRTPT